MKSVYGSFLFCFSALSALCNIILLVSRWVILSVTLAGIMAYLFSLLLSINKRVIVRRLLINCVCVSLSIKIFLIRLSLVKLKLISLLVMVIRFILISCFIWVLYFFVNVVCFCCSLSCLLRLSCVFLFFFIVVRVLRVWTRDFFVVFFIFVVFLLVINFVLSNCFCKVSFVIFVFKFVE